MGHGHGGFYGVANCHGPSEQLYDADFDKLLSDFKDVLPAEHGEVFVTLEACNVDNQANAADNQQEKTFLERVSAEHPEVTFGGAGPWDARDVQTGFRALSPEVPVTSMVGNIWKHGNSVIFHAGGDQIAVKKSLFASTETAKSLKTNTVAYARAVLSAEGPNELIARVALDRDVLTIEDLKKVDGFPLLPPEGVHVAAFIAEEQQVLAREQTRYLTRVHRMLESTTLSHRDLLELTLGLKEPAIFKGHEEMLQAILENKALLSQLMVSCGKVLIGGPSNDAIIDLLLAHGADINSTDERGMTALHHAAQNFYNYRAEPLALIEKLLSCGARLDLTDHNGLTPLDRAQAHSKDPRVTDSDALVAALQQTDALLTPEALRDEVRKIFQMSAHRADELLSLPEKQREYVLCREGTLYLPDNAGEKLHQLLQAVKGNEALVSDFEAVLNTVTHELIRGEGTGQVLHHETDEREPKCFEHAEEVLQPIMDELNKLKQSELPQDVPAATRGPK